MVVPRNLCVCPLNGGARPIDHILESLQVINFKPTYRLKINDWNWLTALNPTDWIMLIAETKRRQSKKTFNYHIIKKKKKIIEQSISIEAIRRTIVNGGATHGEYLS